MDEDTAALFDKSYTFRIVGEKRVDVPKPGNFIKTWKVPELLRMKERLNTVKSGLDAMPADAWGALTQSTNVAALVVFACRTFAGAELCTQAWSKFYEILAKFPDLVNPRTTASGARADFRSLHLCEAPGAFIAALNHYLTLTYAPYDSDGHGAWIDVDDVVEESFRGASPEPVSKSAGSAPHDDEDLTDGNFPSFSCMHGENDAGPSDSVLERSRVTDSAYLRDDRQPAKMFISSSEEGVSWRWVANTLNPYHEGVSSSRAIQADELICRTMEKWIFGKCNTGDILKPSTKEEIISRCVGCADLVTGDGGIDCAADPGEQELLVSDLVISEALVAMSCLREGGNLVLKAFTFFEAQTVCLLYLLALVFDKVVVHKPVASKPGNSELYLLCFGYLKSEVGGIVSGALDYFNWMTQTCRGSGLVALPPLFRKEQIPKAFLEDVAEMGRYFCDLQVDTIERNLVESNFECGVVKRRLRNVREAVASAYLERCRLRPIPSHMYLFGARELAEHHGARPTFGGRDPDVNLKSYAERMRQRTALQRLRSERCKDAEYYADLVETVSDLVRDIMVIVDRSALFPGLPRPDSSSEVLKGPVNEFRCPYTFRHLVDSISVEKGHPVHRILSSPYCPSSLLSQFYELVEMVDMFSDVDELPAGASIAETGWPVDISCAFGLPTIPKGKGQKGLGFSFSLPPDGSAPPLEAFKAFGRHLHVPEDSIVIVNIRSLADAAAYEVFHHPDAAVAGPSHRRDEMVMPLYFPSTVARLSEEEETSIRALGAASPEEFLGYFRIWIIRHLSIPRPLDPAFHELFGAINDVDEDFLSRRKIYELDEGIQRYFDSVWYDFVENKIYHDQTSYPSLRPLLQDAQESETGLYRQDAALLRRTVSAMVMLFEAHLRMLPKGMTSQDFSVSVLRRKDDRVGLDLLLEAVLLEAGKEELLKSEVVDNLILFFGENQLWYKDRLALRGFHLLTRFNVSIFLLLASLFERVTLGKDGDRPEVVLWHFQGTEEDVQDLVRLLEEIRDFLRSRASGYDPAGHNVRLDGREPPSILSLFDSGVDSPVLRDRSVTAFARLINFQFIRGRVRHHLAQVFADGPDLLDMTSAGDRLMGD